MIILSLISFLIWSRQQSAHEGMIQLVLSMKWTIFMNKKLPILNIISKPHISLLKRSNDLHILHRPDHQTKHRHIMIILYVKESPTQPSNQPFHWNEMSLMEICQNYLESYNMSPSLNQSSDHIRVHLLESQSVEIVAHCLLHNIVSKFDQMSHGGPKINHIRIPPSWVPIHRDSGSLSPSQHSK